MLHFEQIINCPPDCFSAFGVPAGKVLFFDIETTGFSPDSSYVYLIGCAFLDEGAVKLRQYFLDDISEEKQLIREFGEFCANFSMLVHYNGSTFDLPYLQKKVHRHQLLGTYFCATAVTDVSCPETASDAFGTKAAAAISGAPQKERTVQQSFDIYKSLLPYKKSLGLKDLKQKTVEQFLHIPRKDVFGGGDLISVYTEFTGRYRYECITQKNPSLDIKATPDFHGTGLTKMPKSPAKALLYVLLLHNHEDITGLLAISALLCIPRLLGGAFTVTELSGNRADQKNARTCPSSFKAFRLDTGFDTTLLSSCFSGKNVKLLPEGTFTAASSPAAVSLTAADTPGGLLLFVPVLFGTFKYFFEDYKEYYYLPLEDCAMHKSVAQFVEKEFRRKATKETCYQKKTGCFLPQPEEIITPAFRLHAKDRFSYFEDTKDALAKPTVLKNWVKSLLVWLFTPT